jgi:hypothetical protein
MVKLLLSLGSLGSIIAGALVGGTALGSKYDLWILGALTGGIVGVGILIARIMIVKSIWKDFNLGKLSARAK